MARGDIDRVYERYDHAVDELGDAPVEAGSSRDEQEANIRETPPPRPVRIKPKMLWQMRYHDTDDDGDDEGSR